MAIEINIPSSWEILFSHVFDALTFFCFMINKKCDILIYNSIPFCTPEHVLTLTLPLNITSTCPQDAPYVPMGP